MKTRSFALLLLLLVAVIVIPALYLAFSPGTGMASASDLPAADLPDANAEMFSSAFATTATSTAQPAVKTPDIYAFVEVPSGPVASPYVILSAYDPISGTADGILIQGTLNDQTFVCAGSPCILPFTSSAILIFRGYAQNGTTSNEVQATVREYLGDGGVFVSIDSINQVFLFADSCASKWNIHGTNERWLDFPQIPSRLNTDKELYFLAQKLINFGSVDTRDCPSGGLIGTMPNACGVERAQTEVTRWQNQYDYAIWSAAQSYGIPPRILKTLFEIESQFWPSNERLFVDEVGLGQVNQLGMDVLLRQNPDVYHQVCSTMFTECFTPFGQLTPDAQAMLRGALLYQFNAACPTCDFGIDLNKARQSVPSVAMVMQANCSQVDWVLKSFDVTSGYEDAWKFTLVSYHSGIGCLLDAFTTTYDEHLTFNWYNVSSNLQCVGSQEYVDRFWAALTSFDSYTIPSSAGTNPFSAEVSVLPTPIPSPTPVYANARLFISVFYDKNANGTLDSGEGVDDLAVEIRMQDGTLLHGRTSDGYLVVDMRQYTVGTTGTVSLPGLYRELTFTLPRQGVVPILFMFNAPVLPTSVP